ncbi:hypothetical protein OsJ_20542 [Oryza sativa Japonica Group]|uniref:Uncharacterized protein n=1 Tax=Oryza sativa subsp. japonica TaxID=39947 RepID=B9FS42_ORYSJ|nr:hypothetical protein OsJ_20542 [Oryza sativa Japonica Group]
MLGRQLRRIRQWRRLAGKGRPARCAARKLKWCRSKPDMVGARLGWVGTVARLPQEEDGGDGNATKQPIVGGQPGQGGDDGSAMSGYRRLRRSLSRRQYSCDGGLPPQDGHGRRASAGEGIHSSLSLFPSPTHPRGWIWSAPEFEALLCWPTGNEASARWLRVEGV